MATANYIHSLYDVLEITKDDVEILDGWVGRWVDVSCLNAKPGPRAPSCRHLGRSRGGQAGLQAGLFTSVGPSDPFRSGMTVPPSDRNPEIEHCSEFVRQIQPTTESSES